MSPMADAQKDHWKPNVIHVPQRWLNAYNDRGTADDIPPEWDWTDQPFKQGYLLIHVPGTGNNKTDLMRYWMGQKKQERDTYAVPYPKTIYATEIKQVAQCILNYSNNQLVIEARNQQYLISR